MSDRKKKGKKGVRDAAKSAPPAAAPSNKPEPVEPAASIPVKEPAMPEKPVAAAPPSTKTAAPKPKNILNTIENAILIFGFAVMLASMFWLDFRNVVAGAVNVIVSPITGAMPFYIVVLAIATIVTIFSTFIQKYTMDWELMRRVNERNRMLSKEMREAQLAGNKAKVKKLQDEQMASMEDQTKISRMQLKPMGFLAIISVPLFLWAYWYLSQAVPPLTMVFPFAGSVALASGGFFIFPWWILWSILCSFALSQVVRKAFNIGTFS